MCKFLEIRSSNSGVYEVTVRGGRLLWQSYRIIATRLVSSECAVVGRSQANWVASQRTTHFAAAETNHSADETIETVYGHIDMHTHDGSTLKFITRDLDL